MNIYLLNIVAFSMIMLNIYLIQYLVGIKIMCTFFNSGALLLVIINRGTLWINIFYL